MDEEKQMVDEESRGLTFKDILFIIRKHWIAIVAFIVCCGVGGYVYSAIQPPVYQSTGTMLVSYESAGTNPTQDYTFSNYISNTYVVFLKENLVLRTVSERADVPVSTLKNNLTVTNNALIIKVSYTHHDADEAKRIVDIIINTAQEIADTTIEVDVGGVIEQKPVYHLLYDNLKVMSAPEDGIKVSYTLRDIAIGLAIGVGAAFIYVLFREMFDNTFKSNTEIERILNIPVLAGIPEYRFDDEKKGGNK
jgi:capsular polysaccharide biosynthesis protein